MFIFDNKHSLFHPYKNKKHRIYKEPLIVMSFDDGIESDYTQAYSIMSPLSIKGTSFINTAAVGNSLILKWTQIHEMHNNGWDFQCHGHTHTRWSDFTTEADMRNQLVQVDLAFQNQSLPIPKHHAYPYGISTGQAVSIINEYRLYQYNIGHILEYNNDYDNVMTIMRRFGGDTQYGDIEKYNLNMAWIRNVYDLHKIGIFYFHAIHENQEATSGCYKQYFVDYLNYIKSLGIRTLTISELYDELNSST